MNILICLSGEVGGTDLLLKKYSRWLQQNGDNVNEMVINREVHIDKGIVYDLVILPTSQMSALSILKSKKVQYNRILIWIMGHGAFRAAYYNPTIQNNNVFYQIYKTALDHLSQISIDHFMRLGSCIFTDEVGMNYDIRKNTTVSDKVIFPIPINCINDYSQVYENRKITNVIKFCWLGRISTDFKVYSLIRVIDDVERCFINKVNGSSIVFTIIGDGDGVDILNNRLSQLSHIETLKFQHIRHVDYDKLSETIAENADYLFAMGTSALDGAKIGCPTIIVQPSTEYIQEPKDIYRWVFESRGYSLGEYNYSNVRPKQIHKSFEQIYDDMKSYSELSEKAINYAYEFDENVIFVKLRNRELPNEMNTKSFLLLNIIYLLKQMKTFLKMIRNKVKMK